MLSGREVQVRPRTDAGCMLPDFRPRCRPFLSPTAVAGCWPGGPRAFVGPQHEIMARWGGPLPAVWSAFGGGNAAGDDAAGPALAPRRDARPGPAPLGAGGDRHPL